MGFNHLEEALAKNSPFENIMTLRKLILDTSVFYEDIEENDLNHRRRATVALVSHTIAPVFSFSENRYLKMIVVEALYLLSFSEKATLSNVVDMLFDGDFFDDVCELVPEHATKHEYIGKLSRYDDRDANKIKRIFSPVAL